MKFIDRLRAKRQDKRVQKLMQDPDLAQAVERLVHQTLTASSGYMLEAEMTEAKKGKKNDDVIGAVW